MDSPTCSRLRRVVIVAAVLAIAPACSNGASPGPKPTATATVCTADIVATNLYYPAPLATNVSTAIGEIIVSGADDGTFMIRPDSAASVTLGAAHSVPSPYPTTLAPPIGYASIALPTLSPNTTYTVTYVPPQSQLSPCVHEQEGPLGSFTTSQ